MNKLFNNKILIVMTSFRAEGTPVLVLNMCRVWLKQGIQPYLTILKDTPHDIEPEFKDLAIPYYFLKTADSGYIRYLSMMIKFCILCMRLRPDAVLSMPFGWHTFFAYAAKLAGVKNVAVHVGSYPYFQRGLNAWKAFLEVKSGNFVTDSFIACSDYVREGLVKNFDISASRVAKIYNGCRAQAICEQAQRSRQARENSRLTMGMVASFENAKDHVTLIEAARMLKDRNADFELWLIGDGSQKEKCRQLAAGYGLEDNIKFLGVRRDIPEILGKMDIFVYSVNREEGLGVAMIEAMAAGVPIIASSVEACTELLENGKLGTLFIPGEPDSLTEAIIYAVNNMALVKSKAKMAADKIFQEFTIEKMAGLYASCLGFHDDNR